MERPQANIEQPLDKYDHELTQLQSDAIALADELLKLKDEGSRWTFVDIVFEGDSNEMLAEIESGPIAELLYAPDEQMAIESDGSYYPVLNIRKAEGRLEGIGLRVWGWDDEKIRYKKPRDQGPPFKYKRYPGEIDKTREIEIAMSYKVGNEHVTEMLKVYVGSSRKDLISVHSQLSMPVYAETGYEGHGGKSADIDEDAIYWLLDFVARHIGDQPKSVATLQRERITAIRREAEKSGMLKAIDNIIEATWEAQAFYFMGRRCKLLDDKSILQSIRNPEMAERVNEASRHIIERWKSHDSEWGDIFVRIEDDPDV